MKKTILVLATLATIISCTENQEESINPLQTILLGKWQYVGFYNYVDIDQADNPYIYYSDNGSITEYFENNTFEEVSGELTFNGTYSVSTDSILSKHYLPTNQTNAFVSEVKILTLNSSILDVTCTKETDVGICPCDAERSQKLNN